MNGTPVYLDHAASSPLLPEILARLPELAAATAGNPTSAHAAGTAARRAIEATRDRIGAEFRVGRDGVLFTSGGTEANNLVIRSFAEGAGTIVRSPFEHPSVAEPVAQWVVADRRLDLPFRGPSPDLAALALQLRSRRVDLVSAMSVHNETGLRLPVAAIGALIRDVSPATRFHVDAVQTFAKEPFDLYAAGVHYLTFSAHKLGAPKGVGGIVIADGARSGLRPLVFGGGQEGGLRSGTENALGIAALDLAFAWWGRERAALAARFAGLARSLRAALAALPGVRLLPDGAACDRIVAFLVEGLAAGDPVVRMLSDDGFAVSAGSACSTGKPKANRHAALFGVKERPPAALLRVSFGPDNLDGELPAFVAALAAALKRARG